MTNTLKVPGATLHYETQGSGPVGYLPGSDGGWGSDPQEFAERLHAALTADVENAQPAPTLA